MSKKGPYDKVAARIGDVCYADMHGWKIYLRDMKVICRSAACSALSFWMLGQHSAEIGASCRRRWAGTSPWRSCWQISWAR